MAETGIAKDPYDILGIKRDATDAEIRTAYRKLAKKYHPDLNPGKADAEERFKALTAAHALLADPEQRARFDRGEIDASGHERAQPRDFYRDFGDDTRRTRYRSTQGRGEDAGYEAYGGFDPGDLESILAQAFAERGGGAYRGRGADAYYTLPVSFLDAVNGAVSRISLPDGRTLDVTVPAGVKEGQVLRLKGQGMPGGGAGSGGGGATQLAGDAYITVTITPHPLFRREGNDIILELPVTLKEAVLGAKIEVPTPRGPVSLRIPANSSSGTRLRLKDRGIAGGTQVGGHQYVILKLVLPPEADPALTAFLESWTPSEAFDPRKGMVTS